jgi:hypothetical protein
MPASNFSKTLSEPKVPLISFVHRVAPISDERLAQWYGTRRPSTMALGDVSLCSSVSTIGGRAARAGLSVSSYGRGRTMTAPWDGGHSHCDPKHGKGDHAFQG